MREAKRCPHRPHYHRSLRGQLARAFVLVTLVTLMASLGAVNRRLLRPWWFHIALYALPIAAIVGVFTANVITGRLRRLRDAVEQLELRNLSVRVPVEGKDEVADLARAFNRMVERLAAEEYVRREFFADVAHELRHPLAVLQGRLEAIQDGISPLSLEQVMQIQDLVLALTRLVGDLRDLSLAEVGQLTLSLEALDLRPLIADLWENMEPVAQSKGIELLVRVTTDLPPVTGDLGRLRQVLINLVTNALHYTPRGGQVEIRAYREAGQVLIRVSDTGSGIAAADLPLIFDRFFRTDRSRSRVTGGTGLGLAIVRSLVSLHGGTVTVASDLGKGSSFTVALPLKP